MHDNIAGGSAGSGTSLDNAGALFSFIPDLQERRRAATLKGGVTHSVREPGELSLTAESHYATVFLQPVSRVRTSMNSDRLQEIDVPAGGVGIVPAGTEARTAWPVSRETVAIVIPPDHLTALAEHECRGGLPHIRFTPAVSSDRWALQMARMFRDELAGGGGVNELYIDSLLTMFGIHVLRKYGDAARPKKNATGVLSFRNERKIREYLAENFRRKLSVADLAGVCDLSPGHFIVAFTNTFGERPHQHLISLRLDYAERLLMEGDMQITQIALLSGFSSQSHLTTALRKHRGVTPMKLRSRQ